MSNITRREALREMLGFIMASSILGCKTINPPDILHDDKIIPNWNEFAKSWWKNRLKERYSERERARKIGERPQGPLPYPYLICGRIPSSRGSIADQLLSYDVDEKGEIAFIIQNKGNGPSYSCYAETYEGRFLGANRLIIDELQLRGQIITTVYPGEKKEVIVPWKTTKFEDGSLTIRCYDPMLDPATMSMELFDRKTTGYSWRYLR